MRHPKQSGWQCCQNRIVAGLRGLSASSQTSSVCSRSPTWFRGDASTEMEAFTEVLPPRRLLDYIGHQAVTVAHADRCAVYFGGEQHGYVTTAVERRRRFLLPCLNQKRPWHSIGYRLDLSAPSPWRGSRATLWS